MTRRERDKERGRAFGIVVVLAAAGAAAGGWVAAHALERGGKAAGLPTAAAPPALPFSEAAAKAHEDAARGRDRALALLQRRRPLGLVDAALGAIPLPMQIAPDPELAADLDDWALLRRERGDAAGARELLESAKRADPDAERAALRDLVAAGDDAGFRERAKAPETAERPAATLALLGKALRTFEAEEAADRLLERAVDRHPGDFRLRLALAELLPRRGPHEILRARAHFGAAVALRPRSVRAAVGLGWLLLDPADLAAQAILVLEAATRRLPEEPAVAWTLGRALMSEGHGAEARRELDRALALDPKFALARAAIGDIALGEQEIGKARAWFRRSLDDGENPEARDGLAMILLDRGQAEEAEALLAEAVLLHPRDAPLRGHHGDALSRAGRSREAIAELKEAVRLDEWLAEAQNSYAWELVNSGDPDLRRPGQALEHSRLACELSPWSAWYRNTLGVVWYRLGDFAQSESALEESCALPGGGGVYDLFFLAMAKHRLGLEADARAIFDRAELQVDQDPARNDEIERLHEEARETLGIAPPPDPERDGR